MNVIQEAINVVNQVKGILRQPEGWCKNAWARDMFNQAVDPLSDKVAKVSLYQAFKIPDVKIEGIRDLAIQAVIEAVKQISNSSPIFMSHANSPMSFLAVFNDYKTITFINIVNVLNRAIEILQENNLEGEAV